MQGAGRLLLGPSGMAAAAEELRRSVVGLQRGGSCGCRTGQAGYPSSDHDRPGQPGTRPPVRHLKYSGKGVYGFASTSAGVPQDSFGRNIYIDTFDSAYGSGWKRENSFLTHATGGSFCYLFAKHGEHPPGDGEKYRATVIGPGVTPDVMWSGKPAGTSAAAQADADAAIKAMNDPPASRSRGVEPSAGPGDPADAVGRARVHLPGVVAEERVPVAGDSAARSGRTAST